jgi:hypothetical protein
MSQIEIFGKVNDFIEQISRDQKSFQERDVVYLLVEIYKIKERDLESNRRRIRDELPFLSFFRDWVVHTHMHDRDWPERKTELDKPDRLLEQISLIIENDGTRKLIESMQASFFESLQNVVANQNIEPRV